MVERLVTAWRPATGQEAAGTRLRSPLALKFLCRLMTWIGLYTLAVSSHTEIDVSERIFPERVSPPCGCSDVCARESRESRQLIAL